MDDVEGAIENAASRRYREVLVRVNAAARGEIDPVALSEVTMTPDFVREDRRRLIALPPADRDQFRDQVLAWRELGDGSPTFSATDVLAVAGDRLVVLVISVDYASGSGIEMLQVVLFDEEIDRQRRIVSFDRDDTEAALAELRDLQARIEQPRDASS